MHLGYSYIVPATALDHATLVHVRTGFVATNCHLTGGNVTITGYADVGAGASEDHFYAFTANGIVPPSPGGDAKHIGTIIVGQIAVVIHVWRVFVLTQ